MDTEIKNTFLKRLRAITKDRGNRAALRCYWSPATRHKAYPVLGRLYALEDKRKEILAALYAEHAKPETVNVDVPGQSVGKAALRLGDREDGKHPYDLHFRRLLASDSLKDLSQQLHRLVKRLERGNKHGTIGLDYERLWKDLNFWANDSENVKYKWAADFWKSPILPTDQEGAEI
jgi:CRISPR type I-E-associated protein CasB/Cse2